MSCVQVAPMDGIMAMPSVLADVQTQSELPGSSSLCCATLKFDQWLQQLVLLLISVYVSLMTKCTEDHQVVDLC